MTAPEDPAPEAPPLQVRVVGGGEPTSAQLAALVVALTPAGGDGDDASSRPRPGWALATLHEGIGGRRSTSAQDVGRLRR